MTILTVLVMRFRPKLWLGVGMVALAGTTGTRLESAEAPAENADPSQPSAYRVPTQDRVLLAQMRRRGGEGGEAGEGGEQGSHRERPPRQQGGNQEHKAKVPAKRRQNPPRSEFKAP